MNVSFENLPQRDPFDLYAAARSEAFWKGFWRGWLSLIAFMVIGAAITTACLIWIRSAENGPPIPGSPPPNDNRPGTGTAPLLPPTVPVPRDIPGPPPTVP